MALKKMGSVLLPLLFLLAATFQINSSQNPQTNVPRKVLAESALQGKTSTNRQTATAPKKVKAIKVRKMKYLPEGNWGGQHILLAVSASGAVIEYDCAHGTIDQKIALDKGGRFVATGGHEDEPGGPVQDISAVDEDGVISSSSGPDHHQAARYTGRVTANKMTLTVTLINTGRTIGTFDLIKDAAPRLKKCL
jgi:hypothetical protein